MADDAEQAEELVRLNVERREHEALKLGFTADEAEAFARSTIALSKLRRMVDNGCPPDLAVRILL